jgi:hypothetical protein
VHGSFNAGLISYGMRLLSEGFHILRTATQCVLA